MAYWDSTNPQRVGDEASGLADNRSGLDLGPSFGIDGEARPQNHEGHHGLLVPS